LLASPVRTLNVNLTGDEVLPADSSLRIGTAIAQQSLNQPSTQPLMVALISDATMNDTGVIQSVRRFEDQVRRDPEVTSVVSYADGISPGGPSPAPLYGVAPGALAISQHTGLLAAQFKDQPNTVAAKDAVKRIRGMALPANLRTLVGGEPAFDLDWTNSIYGPFPWIIAAVLAITYLLLLVGFRSIVLPLKAIVMNLLSIAVAYGIVTFIFQWGHLRRLLDFSPQISIESTVPIVMFAGLFGLSMDYEVFLLSRVAEEYRRSGDNRQAVALGMEQTGRIITSAATVMVIVFGFFALSALVATKEVGLGFAIAIAVDATIIRLLLVPAWMRVLGRWNWWLPNLTNVRFLKRA
jgi:RND superfamily putative drug exporter